MIYYEDLKPYKYWSTGYIDAVLNVGWLTKEKSFPTGTTPIIFVEKLEQILLDDNSKNNCKPIVNTVRGFFDCELCNERSDMLKTHNGQHKLVLGNAELLISHYNLSGIYFSAPTLISHYIVSHNYLPPKEFIDSVINLDLKSEFNGSDIFEELIKKHGGIYLH